jgi:spore coat polysaccharide biosynthesis protein SpsF
MALHSALVIVQARMGSSRLPGKVLLDIAGQPMLARVTLRARRARSVSQVVIATTIDPEDDAIFDYCRTHGFLVFRGNQFDVLDRYYQAARLYQAEVVVRITADCPLMDPAEIDHVVSEFERSGVDFAANRLPPPWKRTYPIGLDIEVCTFAALERAWHEAKQPFEREHVMPYLYDQAGRFKILVVDHDPDYGNFRWTVDTPEDLEAVRSIYAAFNGDDGFSWLEVADLYDRHSELKNINQSVAAKTLTMVDHRLENQK